MKSLKVFILIIFACFTRTLCCQIQYVEKLDSIVEKNSIIGFGERFHSEINAKVLYRQLIDRYSKSITTLALELSPTDVFYITNLQLSNGNDKTTMQSILLSGQGCIAFDSLFIKLDSLEFSGIEIKCIGISPILPHYKSVQFLGTQCAKLTSDTTINNLTISRFNTIARKLKNENLYYYDSVLFANILAILDSIKVDLSVNINKKQTEENSIIINQLNAFEKVISYTHMCNTKQETPNKLDSLMYCLLIELAENLDNGKTFLFATNLHLMKNSNNPKFPHPYKDYFSLGYKLQQNKYRYHNVAIIGSKENILDKKRVPKGSFYRSRKLLHFVSAERKLMRKYKNKTSYVNLSQIEVNRRFYMWPTFYKYYRFNWTTHFDSAIITYRGGDLSRYPAVWKIE